MARSLFTLFGVKIRLIAARPVASLIVVGKCAPAAAIIAIAVDIVAFAVYASCVPESGVVGAFALSFGRHATSPMPFRIATKESSPATVDTAFQRAASVTEAGFFCASLVFAFVVPLPVMGLRGIIKLIEGAQITCTECLGWRVCGTPLILFLFVLNVVSKTCTGL